MAYKPKVLAVADGGTGSASHTAYAVLCGGTSSTGAFQSIAGVGTTGQILTSNGASNLPTFQTAASGVGYALQAISFSGNPADGGVYFLGCSFAFTTNTTSGNASSRLLCPIAGTITAAYGDISVGGTLGSNQNCTLALRLNNTTDTTVTATLQLTATSNTFSNTGLSISVSAGDYVEFKFTSPTWSPNPTTVRFTGTVYIS